MRRRDVSSVMASTPTQGLASLGHEISRARKATAGTCLRRFTDRIKWGDHVSEKIFSGREMLEKVNRNEREDNTMG